MGRSLLIYVSVHHGNTEKVATAIAVALEADSLRLPEVDVHMIRRYDLIGFGSGIYFGKHHRTLLDFVDGLPVLREKKAFVFSTSGLRRMRFVHDFSKPLLARLERRGFDIVGEFSCRGFDTFGATMLVGGIQRGRPDERDLDRAASFARTLRDHNDR